MRAIQTEGTFPEEEISDVETSDSCNTLDQTDQLFRVTPGPLDCRLIKKQYSKGLSTPKPNP